MYSPGDRLFEDFMASRVTVWHLRFCWLPKKCSLTKQIIWLKKAYMGRHSVTLLGETSTWIMWHKKEEHILWRLRK